MYKPFAITLTSLFLAPALALACSGPAPVSYNPLDFLAFGVAAGAFYRLFLERLVDGSDEFHSAIYLSFLIASFGAGVIVSGELSLEPNMFHAVLGALAAFGSLRTKSLMMNAIVLVPVFCISALLALFSFAAQDLHKCNFDANPVTTEIVF
ncbi:hypothetical protein FRD01_19135 [Microvenator marinus]|uniref:Uncharacterized protein n=1 Tax=Microvenator marinus TaxID=2600177 RepID=A0A5B8XWI6_9DELT|nr:hypothetical protein [Microvenator marinus]QED29308.1 hypothetical protein FRD01_19135 [Microvenator marinus]